MVQSSGNERLTAFVSTLVAVAILAAGVTAHQSAEPQVSDVAQVASDLRFQLEMALRHDTREREARLAELDAVLAAWSVAPQSRADQELLLAWLREAGANSLPGVMRALPPLPEFSKPSAVLAEPAQPFERARQQNRTVQKVPTPSADDARLTQPNIQPAQQMAQASTPPTLDMLAGTQGAVAAVTPTPADPLEEVMIALRQPDSRGLGAIGPATAQPALAPRPRLAEQPMLVEKNLLASVPVANDQVAAEPVVVNLTELVARIAGYHDGLDEVELTLLRMDTPDLAVVTEQVNKLDRMTRDYGFVRLYYDSLTPQERNSMRAPRSMEATLAEVKRQLARCEAVLDGDFLGSFDAAAKREFADLRARIAEIERRTER